MADKILQPDGSVATLDGRVIEPPDEERARAWRAASPAANKFLSANGRICGLEELIKGVSFERAVIIADAGERLLSPGYTVAGEIIGLSGSFEAAAASPIVAYEFGAPPNLFYVQGYPTARTTALAQANLFGSLSNSVSVTKADGQAVTVSITDVANASSSVRFRISDGTYTQTYSVSLPSGKYVAEYGLIFGTPGYGLIDYSIEPAYGGGISGGVYFSNNAYSSGYNFRIPVRFMYRLSDGTLGGQGYSCASIADSRVIMSAAETEYAMGATRKSVGSAYTVTAEWA
jgi:hypothetical protein